MGKPTRSTPEYRDDPDAVSLHTTPDDYSYEDAPQISGLPPSYADSEGESSATSAPQLRRLPPGLNRDPNRHDAVHQTAGKFRVCETQDIMDARYDSDPEFLEKQITEFARVPPNPLIYIMGTHKETTRRGDKKETQEVTDFRLVLNMQEYLWNGAYSDDTSMHFSTVTNGEKTHRGTALKKRAPGFKQDIEVGGPEAPGLREWCHRYCASHSSLKIFRLRRTVLGFDETSLKNKIEGLIRSTNYRGHLQIQFPIEGKNVDIWSKTRINEWRLKKWVCWIFYLTFLWIFTWPYLFFATKRFSVVKAEWLFSHVDENGNKQYATISEDEWFNKWCVGIRRMVLDKYYGEASYAQLEGVMERPADPPIPGTLNTGHAGIDNAVGLLSQGFQVASAIRNGGNIGRGIQGGWGYDN